MAGNANSGGGPEFKMGLDEFKAEVKKYKAECETGDILRPSLSHFCGRMEITEEDLTEWLKYKDNPGSTYYTRAKELRIFLTWLRGEMFSSGKYDGATAKKFVEMQLGKDYGDGMTFSSKPETDNSPKTVQIIFGGSDKRAMDAAK